MTINEFGNGFIWEEENKGWYTDTPLSDFMTAGPLQSTYKAHIVKNIEV